jgi:hypothetical protein
MQHLGSIPDSIKREKRQKHRIRRSQVHGRYSESGFHIFWYGFRAERTSQPHLGQPHHICRIHLPCQAFYHWESPQSWLSFRRPTQSGVKSHNRRHSVKLGTSASLRVSFFVAACGTQGQLYLSPTTLNEQAAVVSGEKIFSSLRMHGVDHGNPVAFELTLPTSQQCLAHKGPLSDSSKSYKGYMRPFSQRNDGHETSHPSGAPRFP